MICPREHVFQQRYASSTACPICLEEENKKLDRDIAKVHTKKFCYRCERETLHTLVGPYHGKYYWKCGCGYWRLAEMSKDVNLA